MLEIAYRDSHRIAHELIAEIASEWTDTPTSRCIQEADRYIFEFVLLPHLYMRFAEPFLAAESTIRFDPLSEAIEIVLDYIRKLRAMTEMDSEMKDHIIRRDAKARIQQMLNLAPHLFLDTVWQTRIMAEAVCGLELMRTFGKADSARTIVRETLDGIEGRLKKHLGRVSSKRNRKINQSTIHTALMKFFPQFKRSGKLPSQGQFAKAIGVTPKAWRTFLANRHFDKHEITIKEWYEIMLAKETGPEKSIGIIGL